MGLFDNLVDKAEKVPVSTQLAESEYQRLMDLAVASKINNRGALVQALLDEGMTVAEEKLGGREKVKAAAAKLDPEDVRYERRTRGQ